jgi:hypothetical protein
LAGDWSGSFNVYADQRSEIIEYRAHGIIVA